VDPETNEPMDEVWGWGQLVSGGFVEYVDTEEEETTLIAMTMKDLALQRDAVSCLVPVGLSEGLLPVGWMSVMLKMALLLEVCEH
jgi:hypothetical protein